MLWVGCLAPLPLKTQAEPEEVFRSSGKIHAGCSRLARASVLKTSLSQSPRWAFLWETRPGETGH